MIKLKYIHKRDTDVECERFVAINFDKTATKAEIKINMIIIVIFIIVKSILYVYKYTLQFYRQS